MKLLKNIHLLRGMAEKDLAMMEHAALEHSRYNNITFKIVEYTDRKVIIQVVQGENAAGVYHDKKRLVEIVHETFGRFFQDKKIQVHPIAYIKPPVEVVTPEWIESKMVKTGIKLKDIVADTGLSSSQVSALKTGGKNISQQAKAFFYYYFLYKQKTAL